MADVTVEIEMGDFRRVRQALERGPDEAAVCLEPGEWWLVRGEDVRQMLRALRKCAVEPDQSRRLPDGWLPSREPGAGESDPARFAAGG